MSNNKRNNMICFVCSYYETEEVISGLSLFKNSEVSTSDTRYLLFHIFLKHSTVIQV